MNDRELLMSDVKSRLLSKLITKFEEGTSPTQITHYTNINACLNILREKQIRATDYRFLNDPQEIVYGINQVKTLLGQLSAEHNELQAIIEIFNNKYSTDSYHLLVTSFVKECDYLPCWRYYGDNGRGVAITFSSEKFINRHLDQGYKLQYSAVIYQPNKQKELLNKLIDIYLEESVSSPENNRTNISALFLILALCIPTFKHIDWQDENEFRILSTHIYTEGRYIPTPLPIQKIVQETEKLQYELFDFSYEDIEFITIGPSADFHQYKNRIIAELMKIGVDRIPFKIVQSQKKYKS